MIIDHPVTNRWRNQPLWENHYFWEGVYSSILYYIIWNTIHTTTVKRASKMRLNFKVRFNSKTVFPLILILTDDFNTDDFMPPYVFISLRERFPSAIPLNVMCESTFCVDFGVKRGPLYSLKWVLSYTPFSGERKVATSKHRFTEVWGHQVTNISIICHDFRSGEALFWIWASFKSFSTSFWRRLFFVGKSLVPIVITDIQKRGRKLRLFFVTFVKGCCRGRYLLESSSITTIE